VAVFFRGRPTFRSSTRRKLGRVEVSRNWPTTRARSGQPLGTRRPALANISAEINPVSRPAARRVGTGGPGARPRWLGGIQENGRVCRAIGKSRRKTSAGDPIQLIRPPLGRSGRPSGSRAPGRREHWGEAVDGEPQSATSAFPDRRPPDDPLCSFTLLFPRPDARRPGPT